MLKRTIAILTVGGALLLGAPPASAGPPEEVNFTSRCAKGGGVVTVGHGHDYPYLRCSGGRYDGEIHYL